MDDQTKIEVPPVVAANMKIMEYDRQIADAELHVASLKKQRADFVYDANIQEIRRSYQAQQAAAAAPKVEDKPKSEKPKKD
jgi:hypothetical protein